MTRLTLELHPDRRHASRQPRADWGRDWTPDAGAMLAQICNQMQRELEARVSEVAIDVHATFDPKLVHVAVNPAPTNFSSWTSTRCPSAVAVVEAPLVPAHIRLAAENVAVWNRLYVVEGKHGAHGAA